MISDIDKIRLLKAMGKRREQEMTAIKKSKEQPKRNNKNTSQLAISVSKPPSISTAPYTEIVSGDDVPLTIDIIQALDGNMYETIYSLSTCVRNICNADKTLSQSKELLKVLNRFKR